MDSSKVVYLQLTSLYSRIANYWKYYIGQTEQLKRLNVVAEKKKNEDEFSKWEIANHKDAGLLGEFGKAYADYTPYAKHYVYYIECFRSPAITRMAAAMKPMYDAYKRGMDATAKGTKFVMSDDTLKKYVGQARIVYRATVKEFEPGTEKEMFTAMTEMYHNNVPQNQLPDIYEKVILHTGKPGKCKDCYTGKSYADYTKYVFTHTMFTDSNQFNKFCDNPSMEKLQQDAAFQYALSFVSNFSDNYMPKVEAFANKKATLAREYVHEIMEENKGKLMYPDANSTMRISYGQVLSYDPQDGVHDKYFTTLDGLIAKYKPGSDEFDAPKELIDLYNQKDYGRYADKDGSLHTCFITNNDITGGNSGSPVMNARGELIGVAFDGNWEAMSGDIAFDKKYKRTIVCDIRYILFLIDKMGHADNLIKEMDIRR